MPTADPGNHNLVAGEEWRIVGTLLDREGNPLDLTDAVIGWALLDQGGALVRANARIGVLDPPTSGIVNIELTAATTAALVPGLYTDELQFAACQFSPWRKVLSRREPAPCARRRHCRIGRLKGLLGNVV